MIGCYFLDNWVWSIYLVKMLTTNGQQFGEVAEIEDKSFDLDLTPPFCKTGC